MDHLHGRFAAIADNILPRDRTPRYGGYWWIILLIIILAVIVWGWSGGGTRQPVASHIAPASGATGGAAPYNPGSPGPAK